MRKAGSNLGLGLYLLKFAVPVNRQCPSPSATAAVHSPLNSSSRVCAIPAAPLVFESVPSVDPPEELAKLPKSKQAPAPKGWGLFPPS